MLQFRSIQIEQGLSNRRVSCIVQDSLGFIWVGTKNGLNRYDGKDFKVYTSENSQLASNDISVLKIDGKNRLWVGTIGGGISRYNLDRDEFVSYVANSPEEELSKPKDVYAIFQSGKQDLWIGADNGLYRFEEEDQAFRIFRNRESHSEMIASNSILAITEQEGGSLCLGTRGAGLYQFDPGKEKFIPFLTGLPDKGKQFVTDFVNAFLWIDLQTLLIGTNGGGLLVFDTKSNVLSNYFEGTAFEEITVIRSLYRDKEKRFWVGTDGQGLIRIDSVEKKLFKPEQYLHHSGIRTSLANNTVNAIYEDSESNIWLGTAWKGLNVIEKNKNPILTFSSDIKGENPFPVLSVFSSKTELWMGTDGKGLSIFNRENKGVKYCCKQSEIKLNAEFIQCIKKRKNGEYWLGTFAHGLILFDPELGVIEQYKRASDNPESLSYNDVRDIIELPGGNLWLATWGGGLSFFNREKKTFKNYQYSNHPKSISSNDVTSVLMEPDRSLYLSTYGGGLNIFNPKTEEFLAFKSNSLHSGNIASNYIYCMLFDDKSRLWMGTKKGLSIWDGQKFENIPVGNTQRTNTVVALIQDSRGFVWMSTQEGIFRCNPNTKKVRGFAQIDQEFYINSVFKDSEGTLYFGDAEGVLSFNPESVELRNNSPKLRIVDFQLFNKSIRAGKDRALEKNILCTDTISLNHNQTVFTIAYAAIELPFSDKIQYAVKMEGFDKKWQNLGSRKLVSYTNLPVGEYVFKVKARSHSGSWNENKQAVLFIKIKPPYWKTAYAYILYGLLILTLCLIVYGVIVKWIKMKKNLMLERHSKEQKDKLYQLKQQFFTNISHDIKTPLMLISNPVKSLLNSNKLDGRQQKELLSVKNNTERLLSLVDELLNFRRLEAGHLKLRVSEDNIVSFVHEIYLAFSQQAIAKNINYYFQKNEDEIALWYDDKNLEKSIFNLLSNAFKFTESGGSIKVSVYKDEQDVKIIICDTGQGIRKEDLPDIFGRFYQSHDGKQGFGIGLSIARDIISLHSGTIKAESEPAKGSQFTISLPLGKMHFKSEQICRKKPELNKLDISPDSLISKRTETNSGINILLVEDDRQLRQYIRQSLLKTYRVIEASNGKEALGKTIKELPDLVISDIIMPEMDGITFCSKIKTDVRTSHIPIILLTTRVSIANKLKSYEIGADDYIGKPFDINVLKIRVNNLLQNRRRLREFFAKAELLKPGEIALNSPDELFLIKLTKIMEANIGNLDFNIDQLAKELCMSHSNAYKKIKALTGMTIVGLFKDFRLKRAAQLLKQPGVLVVDVAFEVGYTDRRHFSQEFKRKYGKNPANYQKELRS